MRANAPDAIPAAGRWGALAAAAVLAGFFLAALGDDYALRLLTLSALSALTALGYQLVFGHAGAISLAQGAFFGVGAYASALLARAGLPDLLAAVPAGALAAAAAAVLLAPALRRLGAHAFALATLAGAEVLRLLAVNWESVTGGANGLAALPPPELAGLPLPRGLAVAALAWSLVGLGVLAARALTSGSFGLGLVLMRAAPLVAEASGIDTAGRKLALFAVSALFAGAAGAFYPATLGTVSPEAMDIAVMITALAVAVIGGRTRPAGAVLAALLLVHLPEWLRGFQEYYLTAFALALLAVVLFVPDGLLAPLDRWLPAPRRRPLADIRAQSTHYPPAVATDAPVLAVEQIAKRFGGVEAIKALSLTVGPGEILGVIGPNGSGKTTLINLIGGQERPDRGRLVFAGEEVTNLPPHERARRGIGRSFQAPPQLAGLAAIDLVGAVAPRFGAASFGAASLAAARIAAFAVLARVGLADHAAAPLSSLDPGAARRLDFARAVMGRPKLMLLDEPAAGLAPSERQALASLLREQAASGMALIVVEHDLDFLLPICHRLACLDAGRLIALGPPAAVSADPAVRAAYFGPAS